MTTLRRQNIDSYLRVNEKYFVGRVIDIGGARIRRRGTWEPLEGCAQSWVYLNIDPSTQPDYLGSASITLFAPGSFDAFLMAELLEVVEDPRQVLAEAFRILRIGGVGVITMPFLNQFHPHPGDYQRWTSSKLREEIERVGFEVTEIRPMGSVFAVIYDLLFSAFLRLRQAASERGSVSGDLLWITLHRALRVSSPVWRKLDHMSRGIEEWITTGWGVRVEKPDAVAPKASNEN